MSGGCGDCFGRLWGLQQTPRPNARKKKKHLLLMETHQNNIPQQYGLDYFAILVVSHDC